MVKPGMISLWEGEDKLARPLVHSVDIDAGFAELIRWHQSHQLEEEVRLAFKELGNSLPHSLLERLGIGARNTVPGLRRAEVLIIGRISVVVFVMPAERRETHPHVNPGHRHP